MRTDNQRLWDSYARVLRARDRSPRTIESYRLAATELDGHLKRDLTTATRDDIAGYLAKRLTQISDTTVAIRFRSLRAFFYWHAAEDLIAKSPMAGMTEPSVS